MDQLVGLLPIHFSNALSPNVQIHQFPVLTRPLQIPPSSSLSCKRITARAKPKVARVEIHVPVDTRPEVWNRAKEKEFGVALAEDDREKNQERMTSKGKQRDDGIAGEDESGLGEVRMRSERIPQKGVYMLGVVRDGRLHLHPITEIQQLRPTLTYLDALARKHFRAGGVVSDSDPDPEDSLLPSLHPLDNTFKKERKLGAGEAREAQVSARKPSEKGATQTLQGGLSSVRREMLSILRAEEDERWEDLEFYDERAEESAFAFKTLFSRNEENLDCKSDLTALLKDTRVC